ncbi:MAG TPA: hypothetical protein VNE41_08935 [Chitinophagaceae bacterium]|nr:hypothetical protein [Chitinophagaceae bacterium]
MKFLKIFWFGLLSLLVLGIIITFVLPSRGHAEISGLINVQPDLVIDQIGSAVNVPEWIPFSRPDSGWQFRFTGPAAGAGGTCIWKRSGNASDDGSYTITRVIARREVDFLITVGHLQEKGSFILAPSLGERSTWFKWFIIIHTGIWPWQRFFALSFGDIMEPAMNNAAQRIRELSMENYREGIMIKKMSIRTRLILSEGDSCRSGQITKRLALMYSRLHWFMDSHGLVQSGHPIAQYFRIGDHLFEVHAGVPVDHQVPDSGKFVILRMPSGHVLRGRYFGGYSGIRKVYEVLEDYARRHLLQAPAGPWEEYVTDTSKVKDSLKWETDVFYPIY